MIQEPFLATAHREEVLLSHPQGRYVCAMLEGGVFKLDRIVFPEADRADEVTAWGLIVEGPVPAARACMFFTPEHMTMAVFYEPTKAKLRF